MNKFIFRKFSGLKADAFYSYTGNLTAAGSGFILTVILARILSPSEVGALYTVIATLSLIALFFDLKTEEVIVRYSMEFKMEGNKTLAKAVCKIGLLFDSMMSLILVAALYFMAPFIGRCFKHIPDFAFILKLYLPSLFFLMSEGSYNGVLQSFRKFNYIAAVRIQKNVLRLLLPLALIKFGITGVLIGFAVSNAVSFFTGVFLSVKEMKRNFGPEKAAGFAELPFYKIKKFMLHIAFSSTIKSLWADMDMVILGFFRLPSEVGFYKIGKSLTLFILILVSPIQEILYPVLTKLYLNKDKRQYLHIIKKTMLYCFAVVFPAALFMFLKPAFVIKIFYPPEYIVSSVVMRILIPGAFIMAMTKWARPFSLSIEKPQISTLINCIAAVMLLGFSIIFVPAYGMIASALVMSSILVVVNSVWFFIAGFYLKKDFK
ncbi:flippase [bacterium]|nr:flippase [bacterium]